MDTCALRLGRVSQDTVSWERVRKAADKLTTDDRYGLALPVEDSGYTLFNFWPFMWMAGADVRNAAGDYTVDTPAMADALDFWGSFQQSGDSPSTLQIGPWDVGNIATGVAAMGTRCRARTGSHAGPGADRLRLEAGKQQLRA